jgi:hypothetical protein
VTDTPDLQRVDRRAVQLELQELVDSVRAARVFATLGDWDGVRRALVAHDESRERLQHLLGP